MLIICICITKYTFCLVCRVLCKELLFTVSLLLPTDVVTIILYSHSSSASHCNIYIRADALSNLLLSAITPLLLSTVAMASSKVPPTLASEAFFIVECEWLCVRLDCESNAIHACCANAAQFLNISPLKITKDTSKKMSYKSKKHNYNDKIILKLPMVQLSLVCRVFYKIYTYY